MLIDPHRGPDFNKLISSEEHFNEVRKGEAESKEIVASHVKSLSLPLAKDTYEAFSIPQITADGAIAGTFSARRFNDYLCGLISTKIVPYAHGKIENILITVPSFFDRVSGRRVLSERHERHYKAFIAALSGTTKYTVVCHPQTKQTVEGWFAAIPGVQVDYVLSPRFDYTIWAQDAYVGVTDSSGRSVLCEGVLFPRADDMTIADDVSVQTDVSVLQSNLYFQGGNVLGGLEKTLIGYDYIWQNTTRAELETPEKVVDKFSELFGTEVLFLGGANSANYQWLRDGVLSGYGFQPIFHLDMYVTPTGIVGASGKEIVLLGRPSEAHRVVGRWAEIDAYNDDRYDAFFEETEDQLSDHFEVKHLPVYLTYSDLGIYPSAGYYNLTFNNVVLENYNDGVNSGANVVMTTYAQDSAQFGTDAGVRRELEDAAEETWSGIGYTVHRMDGMEELARGLGSIHCITKTMQRGVYRGAGM